MSIGELRQKVTGPASPPWLRDAAIGLAVAASVALVALSFSGLVPGAKPVKPAVASTAAPMTPAQLDARDAAAGPIGGPMLFRIKGAKSTVYIFGSVHILRSDMGWMSPRIYSAFDTADEAWFEVPDPYAATHVKRLGETVFASKPVLLAGLTDAEKTELAEVLRPYDISPQDVPRLKPAVAAGLVNGWTDLALGFAFDRGADMSLMKHAQVTKKPVRGFETVDEHIVFENAIARLPRGDGTTALKRALAAYAGGLDADGDDITSIAACWRSGDEACITRGVLAERKDTPGEYDILLRQRNARWVPRIAQMVAGNRKIFITVGCAHLVGPDGLVARLRAAGYTVDRVDP